MMKNWRSTKNGQPVDLVEFIKECIEEALEEKTYKIKLDDLKGQLSVRSINTLKWIGYKYLEEVCPVEVERRVVGKKTRMEILEFIKKYKGGCLNEKGL